MLKALIEQARGLAAADQDRQIYYLIIGGIFLFLALALFIMFF